MPFDPFGDHATRGYLRNSAGEADPERVKRLEHRAFAANVPAALRALQNAPELGYEDILSTNRLLFRDVYPWAGQDRAALAPALAIGKAGHFDLFAHPADVRRAAEYGLGMGRDPAVMRAKPGEVLGTLAFAHPFLETNGRTLMTVHSDMANRAGFHVAWQDIGKAEFLQALTDELRRPGTALDRLLAPHIRPGPMPLQDTAARLGANPGLNPPGSDNPAPRRGPAPGSGP